MLSIGPLGRMSIDSSFLFNTDELLLDEQLVLSSNGYLHTDKPEQSNNMLNFHFVLPSMEACNNDSLSTTEGNDYEIPHVQNLVPNSQGNHEPSIRNASFQEDCLDSILALSYPNSSLEYKEDAKIQSPFATEDPQLLPFSFSNTSSAATTPSLSTPTSFLITPIYENPLAIDPTSICRPCDILEFNDSFTKSPSPSNSKEKSRHHTTEEITQRGNNDHVDVLSPGKQQKNLIKEGEYFATEFVDIASQFTFDDLFRDLEAMETNCEQVPKSTNSNDIADILYEFLDTESSEGIPDKEDMDSDYTPPSSRRSSISLFSTEDIPDVHLTNETACNKPPQKPLRSSARKNPRKRSISETNDIHESEESIAVYTCDFPSCGKAFTRLYNLKSHYRTHTDDRPFACDKCDQTFSRNHDLKRHYKIHSGVKPFNCEHCGKKFSRMDALGRHRAKRPQCRE